MKERINRRHDIPLGLPRIVLAATYFLVISLTGTAIFAADPLQQMMKLNGAYSHIEDEKERTSAIASVVGFGLSFAVLSGVIVGPTIDFIGTKITGVLGICLHALGFVFMFLTTMPIFYYIAGVCFGIGYQFIQSEPNKNYPSYFSDGVESFFLNGDISHLCPLHSDCHLTVGCLFLRNSNLILTLLSAASDLSLFIPYTIFSFAKHYGYGSSGVHKAVIQYLLVFVTAAAIIEAVFLPMRPFISSALSSKDKDPEKCHLLTEEEPESAVDAKKHVARSAPYVSLSVKQQLATLDYWLFVLLLGFAFCRKKHFSLLIRPILLEMDSDPKKSTANFYADLYNAAVPGGFIAGLFWGASVDHFGIHSCIFASNALGTIFVALSLVPWLELQLLTIGIYVIYQCFIMCQITSFCASVYGFASIATLRGICSSFIGIFSLLMDFFWPSFITTTLGSYRIAGFIWLVISLGLFACPVALTYLSNRRKESSKYFPSKPNSF